MSVYSRYTRWEGKADPLAPPGGVDEAFEQLGDQMLAGAGGRAALRALQRRGLPGRRGVDDLRHAVTLRRRDAERALDVEGPIAELHRELAEVVALERTELAGRGTPDARLEELELDALPRDPVARLRALSERQLVSDEATERLRALHERLQHDLLQAHLQAVSAALGSVGPTEVARITAMLADLNRLLAARAVRGGTAPPDEPEHFATFLERHGDLVPSVSDAAGGSHQPRDLDELMSALARRALAAQQFIAALSDEQRSQLRELADAVFGDLDLGFQLDQLARNAASAYPAGVPSVSTVASQVPVAGQEDGSISALVDAYERAAELDELQTQLAGRYEGASLDDIDEEVVRRHLGEDAVRDLGELKAIERELERTGAVRVRDGELELTPRGARILGERALARIMARVHREPTTGAAGADPEPTGQTRPWSFGDHAPLAVRATVHNAVLRRAGGAGAAHAGAVSLSPEDLEVEEHEVRPRTATALLLDLSFSMPLQGHFAPAKRMALALHALIEGRHRQDSLHLIGFSDYARRMQPYDLAAAGFERVYGTNMHHAFLLARRVLVRDPRPVKRVVMVTDGEPTAHLVDGRSVFHWPPVPETLEATLREALRLAGAGIELDVFLLEDEPRLVAFAQRLAALTGGEVMVMDAEAAARAVVATYGERRGGRSSRPSARGDR